MLRRATACLCLLTATLAASCGGSSDGSSNGDVVPGSTRIAWDQTAANATELAGLHFVIYIDNVRSELPGAACSGPAGSAGFSCEATLPSMASGRHTIQLAAYVLGDVLLESPKSAPLTVTVSAGGAVSAGATTTSAATAEGGAASPHVSAPSSVRDVVTRDGVALHTAVVAAIVEPTALAIADDGTIVVGNRAGTVSVMRGGVATETALASDRVLDLVLDPGFARSHLLYVLDTVGSQPATFRLARYREVDGRLGERAIMLDGVPARPDAPSGALAIGADGRLFVALDDAGEAENAARPGSYNGKVLRLTIDGRTPGDQTASTPRRREHPGAEEPDVGQPERLPVAGRHGRRARHPAAQRRSPHHHHDLPPAAGPRLDRGLSRALIPAFAGDLLVASAAGAPSMVRVRLAGSDAVSATESLTVLGSGSIRTVKVSSDGAIYALTDDAVLRIAPPR